MNEKELRARLSLLAIELERERVVAANNSVNAPDHANSLYYAGLKIGFSCALGKLMEIVIAPPSGEVFDIPRPDLSSLEVPTRPNLIEHE